MSNQDMKVIADWTWENLCNMPTDHDSPEDLPGFVLVKQDEIACAVIRALENWREDQPDAEGGRG